MRHGLTLALLVSLSACGGGSSPTSPTPTPTPSTYTLSGRITDAGSGHGLTGAKVTVVDGPNAGKSVTTDSLGLYEFDGLRQAGFTVKATADFHNDTSKGVTLTADSQLNLALTHVPLNIEYRVTGSARSGSLTWSNESEGTSQTDVNLPYSIQFVVSKSGQFLYISVQNDDNRGDVTAAIYINGALYKTSTSSGAFVIATSSGETP